MKRIAFFCIPAAGHTNPMMAVAKELIKRGNAVRFYSFDVFAEKICAAGAQYISCDRFLPALTEAEAANLLRVSTTEMTLQDIRTSLAMNDFIEQEFSAFPPDVIYTDSVCFWGKLNAWKHNVPMVVSTSTFAFNQFSSGYMKNSPREMADLIFGLPKVSRELKNLRPYGYPIKSALSLVQNDNNTDTVVYTSESFQPYSASFSGHYAFVGPSLDTKLLPQKEKERPLVYISLGTVIHNRPDFYRRCFQALGNKNLDVILSYGQNTNPAQLGTIPENFKAYPSVPQLEVLSRADAFITHCGMNSVSEALYMATPMVLFPQTGEQHAVAKRMAEMGAGIFLKNDSPEIIAACVDKILSTDSYAKAARRCSEDFRRCSGAAGAAEFIENAPHEIPESDILKKLDKASKRFPLLYWLTAFALMGAVGRFIGWQYTWMMGLLAGLLSAPITKLVQKKILIYGGCSHGKERNTF